MLINRDAIPQNSKRSVAGQDNKVVYMTRYICFYPSSTQHRSIRWQDKLHERERNGKGRRSATSCRPLLEMRAISDVDRFPCRGFDAIECEERGSLASMWSAKWWRRS
jgi:hypothetical protein